MRRQLIALTLAAAAIWLAIPAPSSAQQPVAPCVTTTSSATGAPITSCQPVSAANPLPTTGGGGGGAVTQATVPWVDNITQWASGTLGAMANYGTSPGAVLAPGVNAFVTNTITATISAGSAVIGHVIIDSGTITNVTAITNALPSGTNLLGKVGIDQTTPGTTNGVVVNSGTITANGAVNVTATDCSGTITAGGTAQNAFTAQTTLHGFTIVNIDTTEALWISFTTTAAASGSGSYPLQAATATTFAGPGSFTAPLGFGLNHALSVIAATTSHKFSCTWW